jgi:lipoate-protein ligase A
VKQTKLSWQFMVDRPRAGYENMARDQGLLDLAEREGTSVLRLYSWKPFCISFGRNEPVLRRYDRERILHQGVDTVRRPTGGRAVWHARELTYSVTARLDAFGSLRDAYRRIHLMLARAIGMLGAEASLAAIPGRPTALDGGACFASAAGGEVMILGAKVIGSAQLQQGSAFLQHGSLLLQDSQDVVQGVTRGSPPPSRDRPLASLLGRRLQFEEAAEAIVASWEEGAADWAPWTDEEALLPLARAHETRFRSSEWTWQR